VRAAEFFAAELETVLLWKCCRRKLEDGPVGWHWRHRDLKQLSVPLKAIASARSPKRAVARKKRSTIVA